MIELPRGSSGRAARRTEVSAPDGRTRFSLSFQSPESLNSLRFTRSTYASLTIAIITTENGTIPCLFELGRSRLIINM